MGKLGKWREAVVQSFFLFGVVWTLSWASTSQSSPVPLRLFADLMGKWARGSVVVPSLAGLDLVQACLLLALPFYSKHRRPKSPARIPFHSDLCIVVSHSLVRIHIERSESTVPTPPIHIPYLRTTASAPSLRLRLRSRQCLDFVSFRGPFVANHQRQHSSAAKLLRHRVWFCLRRTGRYVPTERS